MTAWQYAAPLNVAPCKQDLPEEIKDIILPPSDYNDTITCKYIAEKVTECFPTSGKVQVQASVLFHLGFVCEPGPNFEF